MEGESTITTKRHLWSKPESKRHKIYLKTGVYGICDYSELDTEVERLTKERLSSEGWGEEFSGWQRVLSYEENLELAEREGWDKDRFIPTTEVTIKNLDNWTVEKAAKTLNGKQFAQYCRDYGIYLK